MRKKRNNSNREIPIDKMSYRKRQKENEFICNKQIMNVYIIRERKKLLTWNKGENYNTHEVLDDAIWEGETR